MDGAWPEQLDAEAAEPEANAAHEAVTDPDRLAELRDTGLLDSEPEEVFDRITRLAERLLDVPVVLVSLVDRDRQFFKSQVGLEGEWAETRESSLRSSFCQYVVADRKRLVVTNALEDPRVRDNGAVTEQGVIAYAGIPLETSRGHVIGTLCVIDQRPREWTAEELELVADLAALAVGEVDYRLRARALAEIERLSNALADPVADLADAVRSMAGVADRAEDPRVGRLATLARARLSLVEAAAGDLSDMLHRAPQSLPSRTATAMLDQRVMRAVQVATASVPDRDVKVEVVDRPLLAALDAQAFERILVNLLVAMMQHAPEHGAVDVHVAREGSTAHMSVGSEGRAMPVAELGKIVSQLNDALCGTQAGDRPGGASLTSAAGATVAECGPVRGSTGRAGTDVTLTAALLADQTH